MGISQSSAESSFSGLKTTCFNAKRRHTGLDPMRSGWG